MTSKSIVARAMLLATPRGIKSQRALCLAAGLKADFLRDIRSGRTKSPRADNLAKLAEFLGISSDWLLHGEAPKENKGNNTDKKPVSLSQIIIRGEVCAGKWVEFPEWPSEKHRICPIPPGNPWPTAYGLQVGAGGIHDAFQAGSILVCVPISDVPISVTNGMWVIVQRSMPSPDRHELTARRLQIHGNGSRLLTLPSPDPAFPPIPWPDHGTPHTTVTAVIIAAYQALLPPAQPGSTTPHQSG